MRFRLATCLAILAALIVVVASTYHLSESPGIWYDEGFYFQTSMNLAAHGVQELQIAPGSFVPTDTVTVGYPVLAPMAAAFKLFGVGVVQARSIGVISILGFCIAAYALIYLLYGARVAGWSALLLATFPLLYGNGKSVIGEVPGLFFLALALLSLLWLERSAYRDLRAYAAVGLFAGLCVVTKLIFILLLPALFVVFLLRVRSTPIRWAGMALSAGIALVCITLWVHLQFGGEGFARLSYYLNPYETTNLAALAWTNFRQFFTQSTPIYALALFVVWGSAIVVRQRDGVRLLLAELTAFWFSILTLLSYLRLDGWYRYFFPAMTLALVFLPSSLETISAAFTERFSVLKPFRCLITVGMSLLILIQLYQLVHSSYVAGYYQSTRTEIVGAALHALPAGSSFFIYDAPEVPILLPNDNYYQYIAPHPDQLIGAEELAELTKGTATYVVTGAGTAAKYPGLFSAYRPFEVVNRYEILQKKP